jgi:hypothetical protein
MSWYWVNFATTGDPNGTVYPFGINMLKTKILRWV